MAWKECIIQNLFVFLQPGQEEYQNVKLYEQGKAMDDYRHPHTQRHRSAGADERLGKRDCH